MVRMCVVGGCSNRKTEEISLHHFPTEQDVREMWIKAVISTRKNWKGPSKDTVVCSEHFEADCFDPSYDLKKSMGLKARRDLVKGSVPTKFKRPQPNTMEDAYKKVYTGNKSGSAFDKRERRRVRMFESSL